MSTKPFYFQDCLVITLICQCDIYSFVKCNGLVWKKGNRLLIEPKVNATHIIAIKSLLTYYIYALYKVNK
jgi:hypothetical protein